MARLHSAARNRKQFLANLELTSFAAREFEGVVIEQQLVRAPDTNEKIGEIKVVTKNGWFAARPSGTKDIYKLYAESLRSDDHPRQIPMFTQNLIDNLFKKA